MYGRRLRHSDGTDIAFALAVIALAGNRVPVSIKIMLTAIAIIELQIQSSKMMIVIASCVAGAIGLMLFRMKAGLKNV